MEHFRRGPKPTRYSPIFREFPPAAPAIPGRLRRSTPTELHATSVGRAPPVPMVPPTRRARRTLKPLPLFLAHVVSAACRGDWPQNPPTLARLCGCPPGACPPSSGGCESERGGGGVAAPSIGTRDLRPATLRTCPPPDVCGQVGLAIAPSLVRLCGCAPGQRSLLSSGCELRRPR